MDDPNWLMRCIAVLLAGLAFTMTFDTDAVSSHAWLVIDQGLFLTLVSQLLLPPANSPGRLFANSAAGVFVLIVVAQLPVAAMIPAMVLTQVCIVTFFLSLLLWGLRQLSDAMCSGNTRSRNPVLLLTAMISAAPVWLGPFVEMYQPGDGVINGIISITPLTHFSVAAEYDYLRSVWFYRNSPFGSLPFAYPGLISIATTYLVAILGLQVALWWQTGYKLSSTERQKSSLTIS